MKNIFIGLIALVAFATAASYAQPNNVQSVNLIVPTVLRVDISPATLDLDLTGANPAPGTDFIGTLNDPSSTYRYVHNSATDASITVGISSSLPSGLELLVTVAAPPAGGSSTQLDLTGGGSGDAVTGIPRGAGSAIVTYSFTAYATGTYNGTVNRNVTFTMHN